MSSSRVRPWQDSTPDYFRMIDSPLQAVGYNQIDYGFRGRHEYYHVRQAFLRSYQFSTQTSFKEKLKRSVKELNERAMDVIVEIWQEMSPRKLRIRMLRCRLSHFPSFVFRCFSVQGDRRRCFSVIRLNG
uniref:Uncharacterized protein n=1 Tax=Nelumbo nucifera TaxID=4432 RepID=A0A822ZNU6_NELNU|nr:TPA_asm: hypothetical protein HUJ06_001688 [Nelumbo nucifera]